MDSGTSQSVPILEVDLKKAIQNMEGATKIDFESIQYTAAAAIGWVLLARPSELSKLGKKHVLFTTRGDLEVIEVHLPATKTKSRVKTILRSGFWGKRVERHMEKFLKSKSLDEFVFDKYLLKSTKTMKRSYFYVFMTEIVTTIMDYQTKSYNSLSGYSLRVGHAVQMHLDGCRAEEIKLAGGWNSSIYINYINQAEKYRVHD